MANKKLLISSITILFLMGSIYVLRIITGVLFFTNNTLSAPQGVYMRVPGEPQIEDFVVAKLPVDIPEIAGYKGKYLIKQVQGVSGSQYLITKDKLIIRNMEYPITYKSYLPQQTKGLKRVAKEHYLLVNNVFNSLDSRYLGEFSKEDVIGKIILVFEYKTVEDLIQKIAKSFASVSRSFSYENI